MYCIDKFAEKENNYKLVKDIPIYKEVIDALRNELKKIDADEIPNNIYFWCDYGDYKKDFVNNLSQNINVNIVTPSVQPFTDFYLNNETNEKKQMNEEIFELILLNNNEDKDKKTILLLDNLEINSEKCLKLIEKYLDKNTRNKTNISKKWLIFAIGENPFGCGNMAQGDIFKYTKYFDNYIAAPDTDEFLKYAKSFKSFDGKVGFHSAIIDYLLKNKDDLFSEYGEMNGASPIRWESLSNELIMIFNEKDSNQNEEKIKKNIEIECCGALGSRIGKKFFNFLCEKEGI